MSALPEELEAVLGDVEARHTVTVAGRTVHQGWLAGHPVVLCLSGIGKVAAALTTTLLLERWQASAVLFTGVAGGLGSHTRVGDVVVAQHLVQHDMDCSPLFPRHHLPDVDCTLLPTDDALTAAVVASAQTAVAPGAPGHRHLAAFGVLQPQVHVGLVISGDRFVSTAAEGRALAQQLPQALAVEMEGAAMAQVCRAYGVPCAVVRSISDRADDAASTDFPRFLTQVASPLGRAVVLGTLQALPAPSVKSSPHHPGLGHD
jgi:adenosylhomocysteine nucleosidase